MQLRSQAAVTKTKNTSIILLWLQGGASHLETYDMKPEAPDGYRGAFGAIKSNVPGIEICELLPMHAQMADRFTLIRSCTHKHAGHSEGNTMMMSGYPEWDEGKREPVHPECGAVVNRLFGQCRDGMPVAVGMGARHYSYVPGTTAGYWGKGYSCPVVDRGLPNSLPLDRRTPAGRPKAIAFLARPVSARGRQ